MIPDNVHAIFFDAVGTLLYPRPAAAVVYAEMGRRFGSRYRDADIADRFSAAFDHEEEADRAGGLRTSEARELERWRHIVAQVLDDVTEPAACFQELYRHFSLPQAWRLEADAGKTLARLAGRGYILGMASNYDRRLHSVVAEMPELSGLEHLVISSEVGWRKPAAEFFAALCRRIDLPAGQVLHIGDDPVNDHEAALAAGLEAMLFDPGRKHPGFSGRRLESFLDLDGRSNATNLRS